MQTDLATKADQLLLGDAGSGEGLEAENIKGHGSI